MTDQNFEINKTFSVYDKVIWRGKISSDLSDCFYPSFYKDILKREKIFSENFHASFENASVKNLQEKFLPIYSEEIMSRENFTLDKEYVLKSMVEKIEKNPSRYRFFFVNSNDGKLIGAAMFSVLENKLQMAFRAYKRDVSISALRHKASLDYWGEKLIREYGAKMGLDTFSYGRDTHPYTGRNRIGLALYKLKVGTKPIIPDANDPEKPVKTVLIDNSYVSSQKQPFVFFDHPDDNEFCRNCFLFYPEKSLQESFINEFKVVCGWAGLTFEAV